MSAGAWRWAQPTVPQFWVLFDRQQWRVQRRAECLTPGLPALCCIKFLTGSQCPLPLPCSRTALAHKVPIITTIAAARATGACPSASL